MRGSKVVDYSRTRLATKGIGMAGDSNQTKTVAVIVPAFNEEQRIGNVLRAALKAKLVDEVIVVSDGSTDKTAEVARRIPGVMVLDLSWNIGKGGAMAEGVRSTKADIVAFVDADLVGLSPDHIDQIIRPLLNNQCDMCLGVFRGGKVWSDTAQGFFPYLSGQRAMTRKLFTSVPYLDECRMGVEVLLNHAAKRSKARVLRVVLRGVSNVHKEHKFGIVKGTKARVQMYKEIGRAMVKHRAKKKRAGGRLAK